MFQKASTTRFFTCWDPRELRSVNNSPGKTNAKSDPSKVFDKFKGSFHMPNTQRSDHEEAYNIKQRDEKTGEQLTICLTKVFLKFGYQKIR